MKIKMPNELFDFSYFLILSFFYLIQVNLIAFLGYPSWQLLIIKISSFQKYFWIYIYHSEYLLWTYHHNCYFIKPIFLHQKYLIYKIDLLGNIIVLKCLALINFWPAQVEYCWDRIRVVWSMRIWVGWMRRWILVFLFGSLLYFPDSLLDCKFPATFRIYSIINFMHFARLLPMIIFHFLLHFSIA